MNNRCCYLIVLCFLWVRGWGSVCEAALNAATAVNEPLLSSSTPIPSSTGGSGFSATPSQPPSSSIPETKAYQFNPPSGITDQLVVYSDRDGDNEIYIIDCNLGEIRKITDNTAADFFPSWSPDRQHIVFVSDRDGNLELYSVLAESGDTERLTNNSEPDTFPVYSPDGNFIAYFSRVNGKDTLSMLDLNSKISRNLTAFEDGTGGAIVFSPDGKTIFFGFERMEKYKIYSLELPDGEPREIIAHAKKNSRLSTISDPEGTGLFYVSGKGNQDDIWLNYVGDGRFNHITNDPASDDSPSCSPDGKKVVFASRRGGDNWQIFAVSREKKPSENEAIRVTNDEYNYYYPEIK